MAIAAHTQPPQMQDLGESRWRAKCGRCGRLSNVVTATAPEYAWRTLVHMGWRLHTPKRDGLPLPQCRSCAAEPPSPGAGGSNRLR